MITTCAVCGEHVGRSRIEGFAGWESPEGEIVSPEAFAALHKECYLHLAPAERDAFLDNPAPDARWRPDGAGNG